MFVSVEVFVCLFCPCGYAVCVSAPLNKAIYKRWRLSPASHAGRSYLRSRPRVLFAGSLITGPVAGLYALQRVSIMKKREAAALFPERKVPELTVMPSMLLLLFRLTNIVHSVKKQLRLLTGSAFFGKLLSVAARSTSRPSFWPRLLCAASSFDFEVRIYLSFLSPAVSMRCRALSQRGHFLFWWSLLYARCARARV